MPAIAPPDTPLDDDETNDVCGGGVWNKAGLYVCVPSVAVISPALAAFTMLLTSLGDPTVTTAIMLPDASTMFRAIIPRLPREVLRELVNIFCCDWFRFDRSPGNVRSTWYTIVVVVAVAVVVVLVVVVLVVDGMIVLVVVVRVVDGAGVVEKHPA